MYVLPTSSQGVERRPIHGYEGYFASRDGRVFSHWSSWGCDEKYAHEQNQKRHGPRGERSVAIRGGRHLLVHRAVLLAWMGPCPPGKEACHRNGNSADNRVENLYWGTRRENTQDAISHGTHVSLKAFRGEAHGGSKLTAAQVSEIRKLIAEGWRQIDIAARFGIHQTQISRIKRGETWQDHK